MVVFLARMLRIALARESVRQTHECRNRQKRVKYNGTHVLFLPYPHRGSVASAEHGTSPRRLQTNDAFEGGPLKTRRVRISDGAEFLEFRDK